MRSGLGGLKYKVCDNKEIAGGFHSFRSTLRDSSTLLMTVSSAFHGDFIEVYIDCAENSFLLPLVYSQLIQDSLEAQN